MVVLMMVCEQDKIPKIIPSKKNPNITTKTLVSISNGRG
jgi:hypothetical protein